MAGLIGFRLHLLRHHTVLFHQIRRFRPVAAVAHAAEHILHKLSLHRRICIFNHHFKEIVRFLQLIIKGQIVLGQLKLLQMTLFRHLLPKDIQCRKKPASARLLLGRNAPGFYLHRKSALQGSSLLRVVSQIHHIRLRQGAMKHPGIFICFIGCAKCLKQGI